ncbi:hypothetical protein ZWY2020_027468 [Hordeum vulgare]|nr:hypothetical protein ZWY2020_027468 [Hordeum vulgare]
MFFFGPRQIAGLRQRARAHVRGGCSRFELMAACIWRSHPTALGYAADEEVRPSFIVNVRGRAGTPLLEGFYGNAFAYSATATTAEEILKLPFWPCSVNSSQDGIEED